MSLNSDIYLCAISIYVDLANGKHDRKLWQLGDLCSRNYRPLVIDTSMPASYGADWDGKRIRLSSELDAIDARQAITHELVHALSETPRWEWLNNLINGWQYDREQFLERVAHLVGKMFAAEFSH